MTNASNKLFWEIVNCQIHTLQGQGCPGCKKILDVQQGCKRLQIPEPWSGDIDCAAVLFIGANPALCEDEVFPSRERASPYQWVERCKRNILWTPNDVEKYFTGRFGAASCPGCGRKYFDPTSRKVLESSCNYRPVQNQYWPIYNQYYQAVQSANNMSSNDYDFALTDIVHCKGSKQEGVLEASACCRQWTQKVVEIFARNEAPHHSILFVGRQYDRYVPMILSGFNAANGSVVGTYDYRRKGMVTPKEIRKSVVSIAGTMVDVYYGIPAPSNANRAATNICFRGKKIK